MFSEPASGTLIHWTGDQRRIVRAASASEARHGLTTAGRVVEGGARRPALSEVCPAGKRGHAPLRLIKGSHGRHSAPAIDQAARVGSIGNNDDSLERLARAAAHDDAQFDRLARECHGQIHRWALAVTGDPDEADDVVQETFLRVYRSLAGFRGEAGFTTWLYRIVRSVAIDRQRRQKTRRGKLLRAFRDRGVPHQLPATGIDHRERQRQVELVRVFLDDLPSGQRQIFDLADLQGYAPAEIAEMLDMNGSTVRAHLFKARRTIRHRMLELNPYGMAEDS